MKNFQSVVRTKETLQNCVQDSPGSLTAQCKGYAARTSFPAPVQRKSTKGNLPSELKTGIESLSGMSMDDVRVHYNSAKPRSLQALAYAQGSDIHIAPGQERHLPHEAWHVVQQRQGRVQPTMNLGGVSVNDNVGLEREADHFGSRAKNHGSTGSGSSVHQKKQASASGTPVQRQEHLNTGLKKKEAVDRFAKKSKARIGGDKNPSGKAKKWANLTDQQRADKMAKYVNAELKNAHVPPLKPTVLNPAVQQPSFRNESWDMELVGDMSRTDEAYKSWLVDAVYHESRHAEQFFRMARIKAGEGKTATQIETELHLPADVAKAATKRPLKAQSKTSKAFHSKKYNERQANKLQEGDDWYQSIYGTGRQHREDVYADIDNRKAEYEALPEEADAYIVGPKAKDKFKELMGW